MSIFVYVIIYLFINILSCNCVYDCSLRIIPCFNIPSEIRLQEDGSEDTTVIKVSSFPVKKLIHKTHCMLVLHGVVPVNKPQRWVSVGWALSAFCWILSELIGHHWDAGWQRVKPLKHWSTTSSCCSKHRALIWVSQGWVSLTLAFGIN